MVRTNDKQSLLCELGGSCRCGLIVLRLATLSADEMQLSEHDDDQSGTECEVERVELDRDGHCRKIDWVWKESSDFKCSQAFEIACVVGLNVG